MTRTPAPLLLAAVVAWLAVAGLCEGYSGGAGHCDSPGASFMHGEAQPGSSSFVLDVEAEGPPDGLQLRLRGGEFKGFLLAVDSGQLGSLPKGAAFKTLCDKRRGRRRTVTHTGAGAKFEVALHWALAEDEPRPPSLEVHCAVVTDLQEWYWVNKSVALPAADDGL